MEFDFWYLVVVLLIIGYFLYPDAKQTKTIKKFRSELPHENLRKTRNYRILVDTYDRFEPAFTLRARDVVAQQAMQTYLRDAKALYVNNPDHPFIKEVEERVKEFERYERINKENNNGDWKVRVPD